MIFTPVPPDYYVEPTKKKNYLPIPEDKYQVMIFDVEALTEKNFKGDGDVDKLNLTLIVLDDKECEVEDDNGNIVKGSTKGRKLWRKIPRSFAPGSKRFRSSLFYELMCAIERRTLEEADLVKVQPNTLIGQQIAVFVKINDTWNNVESFMKITKELPDFPTILDLEDVDLDKADEELRLKVDPAASTPIPANETSSSTNENPSSVDEFEASMNSEKSMV